jgi:hypothetical protein
MSIKSNVNNLFSFSTFYKIYLETGRFFFMLFPQHLCRMLDVIINSSWDRVLANEINKPYFKEILLFIQHERDKGKNIFPAPNDVFKAFQLTPFNDVRVLLLGQDPYHGPNQAHGLCFSVPDGLRMPPSLKNIFKELEADLGGGIPPSGNLTSRAKKGVFHPSHITSTFFAVTAVLMNFKSSFFPSPLKS